MAIKPLLLFVIHCAATRANNRLTGADVRKWHTDPVSKGGRGWAVPGYSLVIRTDGTIDSLVAFNEDQWVQAGEVTNGALGYNGVARHVCYIGGLNEAGGYADTRTPPQKAALSAMLKRAVANHPDIKICGHNQLSKAKPFCPGFSVAAYCKSIGIPAKNIY